MLLWGMEIKAIQTFIGDSIITVFEMAWHLFGAIIGLVVLMTVLSWIVGII